MPARGAGATIGTASSATASWCPRAAAMQVPGLPPAAELAAGTDFACARLGDGTVTCWGHNDSGQLGDPNTTAGTPSARVIASLPGPATALALGGTHACALVGGDAYCWGENGDGETGVPVATEPVTTPTKVLDGVAAIEAGRPTPARSAATAACGAGA